MKCNCGFEIEEKVAYKHGCLMCGDKSFIDKEKQKELVGKNSNEREEICYHGTCQSLSSWAKELGVNYCTLNGRRWKGWSTEEILKGKQK